MQTNCTYIPYSETNDFSKLVLDYLTEKEDVRSFYQHPVSLEGIKASIKERQLAPQHRKLLVEELRNQYAGIELTDIQEKNLFRLLQPGTFTVCTAHQPNIFTGHLYFVYKILHTIKLCQTLKSTLNAYDFVPVFYMGSEDADLEELGHINLNGEKLEWKTSQIGSVGRMKVDAAFLQLIDRISGQLSVQQFGEELIDLFKSSYTIGTTIQQATLVLVNELFKSYGLLVLIPDNANLKRPFNSIIKRELSEQFSHPIVRKTILEIGKKYKVQAAGRDVNLFYLVDDLRHRIQFSKGRFQVSSFEWTLHEILSEVDEHPERFSTNVILRGVFQEMILPNIAFIGGGGEIAYWLELKDVFKACSIPFPVLVLRNSFLLIEEREKSLLEKLGILKPEIFKTESILAEKFIKKNTSVQLTLDKELMELGEFYARLQKKAGHVDDTLREHILNLEKKASKSLTKLEKKFLRSEKKKFDAQLRQLSKLKQHLFPAGNLQERVENFSTYYARYGAKLIDKICDASLTLEQEFCILEVKE